MSIDAMFKDLSEAQDAWNELYGVLRRAQYDTGSPHPAIDGISVDAFHRKTALVFEIIQSLSPSSSEDVTEVMLSARVPEIRTSLSSFNTQIQVTLNQLRPYQQRDNLVIRDQNNNFSWVLVDEQTSLTTIDVSASFLAANTAINQLLTNVALLLPLCKANAVSDLSARAQALTKLVGEIEDYRNEARKLSKAAETASNAAITKNTALQELLAGAQIIHTKVQAVQTEVEKENATVTTLIAQIKNTGAGADTLEQQIIGYKSKFEAFQLQLDERNAQFAKFEADTKAADEKNKLREAEIDRLTDKADTMIKGATTAGLSKSLEDTRELYSTRMFWARIGFMVSIILLTVSALPLAAYLLPGLLGSWVPAITEGAQNSSFGVLGKIVLLLPGTWLTHFFSKSFSEFFHLEREYAHKAALAKSVEGFKREAPKYEEEITSSVFGEILNNPSSRKSPEPASHPLYDVLTKRLFEWFGSPKGD